MLSDERIKEYQKLIQIELLRREVVRKKYHKYIKRKRSV